MIAVLLDDGLPFRSAAFLRDKGFDVIHVREAGLAAAADSVILQFARSNARACVTLDHDFHMILAETGETQPSVVFLREHKLDFMEAAEIVIRVVTQLESELVEGYAVTATRENVRLRKLPLKVP